MESKFLIFFRVLRASVMKTHAGCRTMRLVRNHPFDLLLVGFVQNGIGIELALALGALGSQDVALERVTALDLARTCLLEAFGRSAVSLKLWHNDLSITT